ncbi:MAG: glycosyltransferase family 2 protein, partial [Dehalococcoidales bacterium]|nr:glycosyltransferase family 2 protein [Dehalococcoidales bacterium]
SETFDLNLIIQIPCYNEENTLPLVLASIPREMPGVDRVEVLVVDDGSTDGTVEVARRLGVDHVVRHHGNRGLAAAFQTGIDACLRLGADVIVNTDGDNQYPQADIPRLVRPILEGTADVVVGDRQTAQIDDFSRTKRVLQAVGSWTVGRLAGLEVRDAPSGFRAYSREAALRLNVLSKYTYTLETLIQAGAKQLRVEYVPVKTNPKLRESRLIKSTWGYVKRSAATIVRVYAMYEPLKVFFYLGAALCVVGGAAVLRFLYYYLSGSGAGHVQSLVLAGALLAIGFQVILIGLVADLIGANRRLLEETLYRVKRLEPQEPRQEGEGQDVEAAEEPVLGLAGGRGSAFRE